MSSWYDPANRSLLEDELKSAVRKPLFNVFRDPSGADQKYYPILAKAVEDLESGKWAEHDYNGALMMAIRRAVGKLPDNEGPYDYSTMSWWEIAATLCTFENAQEAAKVKKPKTYDRFYEVVRTQSRTSDPRLKAEVISPCFKLLADTFASLKLASSGDEERRNTAEVNQQSPFLNTEDEVKIGVGLARSRVIDGRISTQTSADNSVPGEEPTIADLQFRYRYLSSLLARVNRVPAFLAPHSDPSTIHIPRKLQLLEVSRFGSPPWKPYLKAGDVLGSFRLLEAFHPESPCPTHIVVLADAGQGKSWWLQSVVSQIARDLANGTDTKSPLPIFTSAVSVVNQRPSRSGVMNAIISATLFECGLGDDDQVRAWLVSLWRHGRLLVCLDGIDEVSARARGEIDGAVRGTIIARHWLVTTARPWVTKSSSYPDAIVCELIPLNTLECEELARRLGLADKLFARIFFGDLAPMSTDATERFLLFPPKITPLYIALARVVIRDGLPVDAQHLPLQMLRIYLGRPWRVPDHVDDRGVVEAKLRILARIAAHFAHSERTDAITLEGFFALVDTDSDRSLAQGDDPTPLGDQLTERLDAIFAATQVDGREAIRFSNRVFQEALLVHWLNCLPGSERSEILSEHEMDPSWISIVAAVIAQLPPDELPAFFLGSPESSPSRARLHAAVACASYRPDVAKLLCEYGHEQVAALIYSPSGSDRRLAGELVDFIRDERLEWERLAAQKGNADPRPLIRLAGISKLLDVARHDSHARRLLFRSLGSEGSDNSWLGFTTQSEQELEGNEIHQIIESIDIGLQYVLSKDNTNTEPLGPTYSQRFVNFVEDSEIEQLFGEIDQMLAKLNQYLILMRTGSVKNDQILWEDFVGSVLTTLDSMVSREIPTSRLIDLLQGAAIDADTELLLLLRTLDARNEAHRDLLAQRWSPDVHWPIGDRDSLVAANMVCWTPTLTWITSPGSRLRGLLGREHRDETDPFLKKAKKVSSFIDEQLRGTGLSGLAFSVNNGSMTVIEVLRKIMPLGGMGEISNWDETLYWHAPVELGESIASRLDQIVEIATDDEAALVLDIICDIDVVPRLRAARASLEARVYSLAAARRAAYTGSWNPGEI